MKTAEEIKKGLGDFYGTEHYYKYMNLMLTDGIKWLADSAGCYWLLDIIVSYQPQCWQDESLAQMQFWKFKRNATGKGGTVTCERDQDDVAITQKIPFTDFPLDEIDIWVEQGGPGGKPVAMLKSER